MIRPSRYSPEVRDRAVRMVLEHQREHASPWTAIASTAEKIGCPAETLRDWVPVIDSFRTLCLVPTREVFAVFNELRGPARAG